MRGERGVDLWWNWTNARGMYVVSDIRCASYLLGSSMMVETSSYLPLFWVCVCERYLHTNVEPKERLRQSNKWVTKVSEVHMSNQTEFVWAKTCLGDDNDSIHHHSHSHTLSLQNKFQLSRRVQVSQLWLASSQAIHIIHHTHLISASAERRK